jgi:hypothetical protein
VTEYTTAALAVKCSKSERQVQRWISSGKLKARRIGDSNRYEVSDEDLVPFLPHEATDNLLDRISALELKLELIEADISLDRVYASEMALSEISARLNEMADKMIERIDALSTRIKASESLSATLYERVLELERKMQERQPTTPPAATPRPRPAEHHKNTHDGS